MNGSNQQTASTHGRIIYLMLAIAFILIFCSIFLPYFPIPYLYYPDPTLLMHLKNVDTARSLITFVVVVSTVAMALMLVAYITITPDTDIEKRFNYSKEVLASLIVVLGTIIGFYFGSTQTSTQAGTTRPLALQDLAINPATPEKDKTATLNATLSGGQPPYTYAISFTPSTIKEIAGKSPDGKITQEITFDSYDPTKPLDITLQATDSTGAMIGNRLHFEIRRP